jgi:hypothetical protein
MRLLKAAAIAAVLLLPSTGHAAKFQDAVGLAVGAQYAAFDQNVGSARHEMELGATQWLSITPHLSGVGGEFYGANNKYGVARAGLAMTLTDVNDPLFSARVAFERRWCTKQEIEKDQWVADAGVGWKALPWATLIASGEYGLTDTGLVTTVGVRVPFKVAGGAK